MAPGLKPGAPTAAEARGIDPGLDATLGWLDSTLLVLGSATSSQ